MWRQTYLPSTGLLVNCLEADHVFDHNNVLTVELHRMLLIGVLCSAVCMHFVVHFLCSLVRKHFFTDQTELNLWMVMQSVQQCRIWHHLNCMHYNGVTVCYSYTPNILLHCCNTEGNMCMHALLWWCSCTGWWCDGLCTAQCKAIICVCLSVCLHNHTKMAETTIAKLGTGIVHYNISPTN